MGKMKLGGSKDVYINIGRKLRGKSYLESWQKVVLKVCILIF